VLAGPVHPPLHSLWHSAQRRSSGLLVSV
jgi:hypothetical protein